MDRRKQIGNDRDRCKELHTYFDSRIHTERHIKGTLLSYPRDDVRRKKWGRVQGDRFADTCRAHQYHIFYIDKQGYIKQRTNSNATAIWKDGELNQMKLKILDSDAVGLQACWYGNFYGDADYTKFPTTNGQQNTVAYAPEYGMHLWFPSDATTFQQYGYFEGQTTWTFQETWPGKNGHAGVGCYSWGPGTVSYAMMLNLQNSVEFWFKDTNSSLQSTDVHPINSWKNGEYPCTPRNSEKLASVSIFC